MLQRLVLGTCLAATLGLMGCANSPQQLTPQPMVTERLAPVGQGQPVVVRVVDGRASPILGTRGGLYPETSTVTVSGQDLLPRLQGQAEAAVRLLGFTPAPNAYGAPQLTLTLVDLRYQTPGGNAYATEANITAGIRAAVLNSMRR